MDTFTLATTYPNVSVAPICISHFFFHSLLIQYVLTVKRRLSSPSASGPVVYWNLIQLNIYTRSICITNTAPTRVFPQTRDPGYEVGYAVPWDTPEAYISLTESFTILDLKWNKIHFKHEIHTNNYTNLLKEFKFRIGIITHAGTTNVLQIKKSSWIKPG